MTKHKAPTQVTIASVHERTIVHELVERYWKHAVLFALVATAAILIPHYMRQRSLREAHGSWDKLREEVALSSGFMGQIKVSTPAALDSLAEEWKGTDTGAWAKALEVGGLLESGSFEEGASALTELEQGWPDHPLVREALYVAADGSAQTLPARVRARRASLEAWEAGHPLLFSNPPLPEDAPRVRLITSRGPIVVGLYVDRAPKHAENFLKLCREGAYNGTRFHRVVRDTLIQGGDPNSIAGEPDTWGNGGFETTLEPEDDPLLRHFEGALSAWRKPGEKRSSGSQFFITTADSNGMDGQYTVFGRLLEGQSVVEEIETGAVVGDRSQDPVTIQSTEIL